MILSHITPRREATRWAAAAVVFVWLWSAPAVLAVCCKCTRSFGTDSTTICLKTTAANDCGNLESKYPSNPNLSGFVSCDVIDDASCKPFSQNGLCKEVADAGTYGFKEPSPGGGDKTFTAITPVLNVPIPGLQLAGDLKETGGIIRIPFLAQYISAAYQYLAGITVLAAAVMIVYGGFLYILGTTVSNIDRGKRYVVDAVTGLVLLLGSYTILAVIDPRLVSLKGVDVIVIHQDSFENKDLEKQRATESATVKYKKAEAEVPVVSPPTPPPTPGQPEVPVGPEIPEPAPVPTTTAPEKPPPPPGTVVKNAKGELVAQEECPADMVAIKYSQPYEEKVRKKVAHFCMDRFEAPNQRGVKPYWGVVEWEADWYCRSIGKRLCASDEWTRACLGPEGKNTYGYGPTFIPGRVVSAKVPNVWSVKPAGKEKAPCNYDTVVMTGGPNFSKIGALDSVIKKEEQSTLNTGDNPLFAEPKLKKKYDDVVAERTRLGKDGVEPSGSRPACVTAEGVYDLTANVQEIVTSQSGSQMNTDQRIGMGNITGGGKPYTWAGFYFSPISHLANTSAEPNCTIRWGGPHNVGWRAWENGFRCCMDLQINGASY